MSRYMSYSPTKFILLIVFVLTICEAHATEQWPEKITIGRQTFNFFSYPLEQLISKDEFFREYDFEPNCSGAWRGYQGNWSIHTGELFLASLVSNPCSFDERSKTHDLKKILPEYDIAKHYFKADWFSGEIVIPLGITRAIAGRKTDSGHQYYENQFIVYLIEKGNIISRKIEYRED